MTGGLVDRLAGTPHPRLVGLLVVGVLVAALGGVLALATTLAWGDAASFGPRLVIVGALVFLLAASGYVAFAAFERREAG